MKNVIFAAASSTDSLEAHAREIRRELEGHITTLMPSDGQSDGETPEEWMKKHIPKAKIIIYMYEGAKNSDNLSSTMTTGDELVKIPSRELLRLPGHALIIIVVADEKDKKTARKYFSTFRCFDLSDDDSKAALHCLLAHGPITKPSTSEGVAAIVKLLLALVGTAVATADKIRDLLVASLGDQVTSLIYNLFAIALSALLIAAFIGLFRIAIDSLPNSFGGAIKRQFNKVKDYINKAKWMPSWAVSRIALRVAATILVATSFWLFSVISAPNTDALVKKHQGEWIDRLDSSWTETGGIKEIADEGHPQAWMSAQALAALRCSCSIWQDDKDRTTQTLRFFDRTKIRALDWKKPNGQSAFRNEFGSNIPDLVAAPLPATFYNYEMLFGYLARTSHLNSLPEARRAMVLKKAPDFFEVTDRPSEGWGYFEQYKWGVTEIASWVAVAKVAFIRTRSSKINETELAQQKSDLLTICNLIRSRQLPISGGFSPIPDTSEESFARTYSATMSLWALGEAFANDIGLPKDDVRDQTIETLHRGLRWACSSASETGWKVNPKNLTNEDPPLGLLAHTLFAIGRLPIKLDALSKQKLLLLKRHFLATSQKWLFQKPNDNAHIHDSDRYLYPSDLTIEGSTILWYPWCMALLRQMLSDPNLTGNEKHQAKIALEKLKSRIGVYSDYVTGSYNYVAAESLIGLNWPCACENIQ